MPNTTSPAGAMARPGQTEIDAAPPAPRRALTIRPHAARQPRPRWQRFVLAVIVLGAIWAVLTGFRLDALGFGVPAVLGGAALVFVLPGAPGWRLSPGGALAFVIWFSAQSVRGAVDVAIRAFSPDMGLRPGFRRHPLALPGGAPRVLFLNTITLLPGTLSAEVAGDEVIVHMLDERADLAADLAALEMRIAALFALQAPGGRGGEGRP